MQKNRRVVRVLLQVLIFFFLAELFLRVIFYQQFGKEHLAVVELARNIKRRIWSPRNDRIYRDFLLARPDSSQRVNRLIAEEALASNNFEYTPWTEYKNIDFAGKYINTKGLIRVTVPNQYTNPDSTSVQTIYFFGGSTMYGVNITDRETIAAAFVNAYRERYPHGVSIQVVNYGIPAYHSYNELMLLSHLVYSGQKPGIAIILDGLNDFLMVNAVLKKWPYYYYRLKLASKDNLNYKQLESVNDSTNTLFDYPAGTNEDKLADSLVKNYLSNLSQVNKLAVANDFKAFFFVQPNPFYNYPNKKNDPICDQQPQPLIGKAYTRLEKKIAAVENCVFLGNMLSSQKGYPFIDRFHYSPAMCRAMAAEIVKTVGEGLNQHGNNK